MASVKSVEIYDDYEVGTQRERRYKVVITNNSAVDEEYILSPVVVDISDDGSIYGSKKLDSLADIELDSEKSSEYQTQADYDRRALGRAMLFTDVNEFWAVLPLFKAMELRGGSNVNARTAYLGVVKADYTAMASRFNDVEGIIFYLTDAKDMIWEELPPEFE